MSVNSYIDHTLLKADANKEQILSLIDEAKKYEFASVCVNPTWVKTAAELLKDSSVKFVQLLVSLWEHRPLQLRLLKPRMLLPMVQMKLIW